MSRLEPLVFNPADEMLYYRFSAPKGCIPVTLEHLQKVRAIANTSVRVIASGNSILISEGERKLMVRVPDEFDRAVTSFAQGFAGVVVKGDVTNILQAIGGDW